MSVHGVVCLSLYQDSPASDAEYWLGALRVSITGAGSKPGILFGHIVEKITSLGSTREVQHRVAIKLDGGLRSLDSEGEVLRLLAACPAAINCYGIHVSRSEARRRYLVLEIFGADLTSVMTGGDNRTFHRDLWMQVVFALESIHGLCDMVHCDVKPEKILVQINGSDGSFQVKFCDFDSARKIGDLFPHDAVTKDIKCTLAFGSPEALHGTGGQLRVSRACDAFSLGLVVELLSRESCRATDTVVPADQWQLVSQPQNEHLFAPFLQCAAGSLAAEVVAMLCAFDPARRKDLSFVAQHVKQFSATKYNVKNKQLSSENDFLRDAVLTQLSDLGHNTETGLSQVLLELDRNNA